MDGSWDAYLAFSVPTVFFAGVDDITKEREPGIEIIERTSKSLIITSNNNNNNNNNLYSAFATCISIFKCASHDHQS